AAEPHDRAVALSISGLFPAPARLPPVHDLALVPERMRLEHRVLGFDQVLPVGEQLVVGEHHPAPGRPRSQVPPLGRHSVLLSSPPTVWPMRRSSWLACALDRARAGSRALSGETA